MQSRYKITPQMMEYDRIGQVWLPYIMYFHNSCYSSQVVNTDSKGFRVVYKDSEKISDFKGVDRWPVCLFTGGSTAFGVGATSDKKTIPSLLNETTDYLWLNFSGRAFSSTQEILLFLFNRHLIGNIKKIVIFSGINNLVLYHLSRNYLKDIGTIFSWNEYDQKMNTRPVSLRRKILNKFLKSNSSEKDNSAKSRKEDLLDVLSRDISMWKMICNSLDIELYYVLQPFANWVKKKPSSEESTLFAELDEYSRNHWKVLRDKLGYDQYLWFLENIRSICKSKDVPFFDMNKAISDMKLDGKWLFVDRIHLSDEGNRLAAKIIKEEIINT